MKNILLLSAVASAMLMAGGDIAPSPVEETAPAPAEFLIFSNIQAHGEIRGRYEDVATDEVPATTKDAYAYSARMQLALQADLFQVEGLSVFLEATGVFTDGDYWGGPNTAPNGYDAIVDPNQSRFTQMYIDYKFGDTLLRAGRQDVDLDNQRFIGTVDWRQMPQTYDAVAVVNNSIENLNLMAAYVWQVNQVFQRSNFDTESILLHASYKFIPELTLTGYGYLLEDIHDTWGIAATGKADAGFAKIGYRAEYAIQQDASMGRSNADAAYYNLAVNANMNGFLLGAGYEVLSGSNGTDNKTNFTTPLATLHAHNGWADVFLLGGGSPGEGLVDITGMIGYNAGEYGLFKAIYHDFTADVGGDDYGTEWDLLYKNKIPSVKGLTGLLKAAFYTADNGTTAWAPANSDKTVLWAQLDYKF